MRQISFRKFGIVALATLASGTLAGAEPKLPMSRPNAHHFEAAWRECRARAHSDEMFGSSSGPHQDEILQRMNETCDLESLRFEVAIGKRDFETSGYRGICESGPDLKRKESELRGQLPHNVHNLKLAEVLAERAALCAEFAEQDPSVNAKLRREIEALKRQAVDLYARATRLIASQTEMDKELGRIAAGIATLEAERGLAQDANTNEIFGTPDNRPGYFETIKQGARVDRGAQGITAKVPEESHAAPSAQPRIRAETNHSGG